MGVLTGWKSTKHTEQPNLCSRLFIIKSCTCVGLGWCSKSWMVPPLKLARRRCFHGMIGSTNVGSLLNLIFSQLLVLLISYIWHLFQHGLTLPNSRLILKRRNCGKFITQWDIFIFDFTFWNGTFMVQFSTSPLARKGYVLDSAKCLGYIDPFNRRT